MTKTPTSVQNASADQRRISLVCPFYNEQDVVPRFFARVLPIVKRIGCDYEIICVNDGSSDATLMALIAQKRDCPRIQIIDLSRNFGKEAALTAAIDHATGDAIIPIDADLQDPPELIPEMVEKWRGGAEVVLARRRDRSADSWRKRTSAGLFYRIHNRLSETGIPDNVGDFRLMDRRVVDAVKQLGETRRFMKGIFAWVGFKTEVLDYTREGRIAGESKFNGWRLWNFALEGITSFSTAPLRFWLYAGLSIAILALAYALIIVTKTLILGIQLPGYASIIVSILFLGGIQLISIGVLGEYIGRIYLEVKRRPIYIIREIY
ncbi:MAG: glycosyltransferase [Sphingobacteriia bacterium]|nr:glycosyltransferase [Sphingobacteriia bacterium]NCC39436.1 glycosyltransferase [Gammaproteobacteria bacterium]